MSNKSILDQLKEMETDSGTVKSDRFERIEIPLSEEEKITRLGGHLSFVCDTIKSIDSGELDLDDLDDVPGMTPAAADWIRCVVALPAPKPWEPRVSMFVTDDVEYERLASAAAYCNQWRKTEICKVAGITIQEMEFKLEHPRYLSVIKARLEKVGVQGLKDRASRWSTDIAKVYAQYYRVKIKYIRLMLDEIDRGIRGK